MTTKQAARALRRRQDETMTPAERQARSRAAGKARWAGTSKAQRQEFAARYLTHHKEGADLDHSATLPSHGDDLPSHFRAYAETWRRQTRHMSSLTRMISHPAYRAIINMGSVVLPLLLAELRDRPDHWLVALKQISGEDPALANSTFSEAVEAWLKWGRDKGYLK